MREASASVKPGDAKREFGDHRRLSALRDLRLAEVERSINILLDLAEQFGAASAGPQLLEREAEQR